LESHPLHSCYLPAVDGTIFRALRSLTPAGSDVALGYDSDGDTTVVGVKTDRAQGMLSRLHLTIACSCRPWENAEWSSRLGLSRLSIRASGLINR
jgi:hypothetical protein